MQPLSGLFLGGGRTYSSCISPPLFSWRQFQIEACNLCIYNNRITNKDFSGKEKKSSSKLGKHIALCNKQ